MFDYREIAKFYPEKERIFKRQLLREYLQYKILDIIYGTEAGQKAVFIGGTAIRIAYGSRRFSEDIDLDGRNLSLEKFKELSEVVKRELEYDGYAVEMKVVAKNAFRCYLKFPRLLYDMEMSGYEEEKILIQLDSEEQPYEYEPEEFLLNKFAILSKIFVAPPAILLSQKIAAFLKRKRTKARDMYDIVYLYSLTTPDQGYLESVLGIKDKDALRSALLEKCSGLDLDAMKKEIEVFLIEPKDAKMIGMFPEFMKKKLTI